MKPPAGGKRPAVGGHRAGGGRASTRPASGETAKTVIKAPKPKVTLRVRATKLAVPQEPPEPKGPKRPKGAFGTRPAWMNPRAAEKPEKPKPPPKSTPADPIAPGPLEPAAREAWLDTGRLLFARPCTFFFAAQRIDQLPEARGAEIAFCGRSNVGKSSLINALTGQNALARVSRTPGRTRQLNFFDLAEGRLTLVDMPGYGYAEASKTIKEDWQGLMFDFLRGRPTLKRLMLLLDARIETKAVDFQVMDLLAQAAVAFQIVLTKIDDVPARKLADKAREVTGYAKIRAAALPAILLTSSQAGTGIAALRAEIATLAD